MMRTLAILCLVAAPAFGVFEKGLRLRIPQPDGTFTYDKLPENSKDAAAAGWKEFPKPPAPKGYGSLKLMCPVGAYTLCLLYDDTGNVAGAQINFVCDKYRGVFDWKEAGFTLWSVKENRKTINFYSTTMFLVSTDTLRSSKDARMAHRNPSTLLQDSNLYLEAFKHQLLKVSTRASDIVNKSPYTRQFCYAEMGYHYFYKMTKNTPCKADTISQWAPLVIEDQLVGMVFMYPGAYNLAPEQRELFQHPTKEEVQLIVPDGPQCYYEYGASPGMLLMHIYFIDKPETIKCP